MNVLGMWGPAGRILVKNSLSVCVRRVSVYDRDRAICAPRGYFGLQKPFFLFSVYSTFLFILEEMTSCLRGCFLLCKMRILNSWSRSLDLSVCWWINFSGCFVLFCLGF